ncbi:hypothetical protein C8J56DRAFT_1026461 [Mycena floridula]|nr:hypothetical protein C8J56DRAFT_1026461 [Mycena floridula]
MVPYQHRSERTISTGTVYLYGNGSGCCGRKLQLSYQGKTAIATCVDKCATCDGEQIDHQGRRHQKDHKSHCYYHDSTTTATAAACSSSDDSDEDTQPTAVAIVKAAVTTVPPTIVKSLRLQRFLLPQPPLIVKRLLLPMRASFRGCSYDGCISRPHFCSSIYPQSRYSLSS